MSLTTKQPVLTRKNAKTQNLNMNSSRSYFMSSLVFNSLFQVCPALWLWRESESATSDFHSVSLAGFTPNADADKAHHMLLYGCEQPLKPPGEVPIHPH
jgi:hypothetical protein